MDSIGWNPGSEAVGAGASPGPVLPLRALEHFLPTIQQSMVLPTSNPAERGAPHLQSQHGEAKAEEHKFRASMGYTVAVYLFFKKCII